MIEPNTTNLFLNATFNQTYPVFLNATLNQPPQNWKDLVSLVIPLLILALGVLTWALNEWAKRSYDKYLDRLGQYKDLIKLIEKLKGRKPGDPEIRDEFISQINTYWLICPDDVVLKTTNLLRNLNDEDVDTKEKDKVMDEFMIVLRKDALKIMPWHIRQQTKLNQDDYRNFVNAMLRRLVLRAKPGIITTSKLEGSLTISRDSITPPQVREEDDKKS